MSRYTAIIRIPGAGDHVERIECDIANVDGGGDLHLNRLRGGGDSLTIARFQHGHWSSYELEPTAEPDVEAWLREGVMTREQFLGRAQAESADDCADAPVKTEALPEVGETVHVWRKSGKIAGCCPMRVSGRCATDSGVALALAGPLPWSPEFEQLLTSVHDETRTEHASWHWPCEGNQVAEPKPDAPAPISVTFNVSGSVLSERDLRDMIRKILTDDARRAMPSGVTFRR